MTREITADYTKTYLFPPSLEEWVGPEHPARFLREVVGELDLCQYGMKVSRSKRWIEKRVEQGRPYYSDELLLKAWLYGYMSGIRSSRKLERACRENVGLIWLLGREEPDHNTLWRFWKRNRKSVREVFRGVVRIGLQAQLLGTILHAVDGTKIQAQSSSRSQEVIQDRDLKKQLAQIDEAIRGIETEIKANGDVPGPGYQLPEQLQDRKQLREKIREALEVLEEQDTPTVNRQELEARVMKCDGQKRLGYNSQAVVDEASKLVVAEKVVNAAADQHELEGMLEETEKNLGQTAQDTVADKGYRTDQAIGQACEKGQSVLVHLYDSEMPSTAYPYHKCNFHYDEQADVFICPQGKRLVYEKQVRQFRQRWPQRQYRCQDFKECEKASECCRGAGGRTVALGPYWKAVQDQRERQAQEVNQEKLRRRKVIVEPVFAQIKHNSGFRRFTFRGLAGVQAQWSLLCTAYNLNRIYNFWKGGELTFNSVT